MVLECYKLLKTIEVRPAMWTGEETLKGLYVYTSGYYHALYDNGLAVAAPSADPFFDWVAAKLGYYESTAGWVNMILAHTIGFKAENTVWENVWTTPVSIEQHRKSVAKFYELLEEFKTEMEAKK